MCIDRFGAVSFHLALSNYLMLCHTFTAISFCMSKLSFFQSLGYVQWNKFVLWLSSMSPRKTDFEIEFWAIFRSILFLPLLVMVLLVMSAVPS